MALRVTRDHHRRAQAPGFVKFLVTILALAGVSLAVAFVWQNLQDSMIVSAAPAEAPGDDGAFAGELGDFVDADAPVLLAVSKLPPEPEPEPEPDGEAAEADAPPKPVYAREAVFGAVPEAPSVDYSYFDDAIFFGDSISTGIPLYMKTSVPNAAIIAQTGVSPGSANTSQCIDVNGTRVTMLEAAKTKGERKKVYIMLGANALDLDEQSFMTGYRTFVESAKAQYPDAIVYIQSMLPVTVNVNRVYPSRNINNTRIAQYNSAIQKMAAELGVYYLDVAQCMVDAAGALPVEASPLDGMHLTPEYYIKWFDYLRAHTI